MKKSSILLAIMSALIASCGQSDTKDPEFFGSNFSISSCVQYAGDGAAIENFMESQMKIAELSHEMAKHFLGNSKGKAWSLTSPDGSYAVTYREDGICTVFVKETNVAKYIQHLNKNIERISKGTEWKFSPSVVPMFAGESELKSYELSAKLPGKNVRIVISAVNKVIGNYQVAFSTSLM